MATVGRLNVILSAQVRGLLRGLKRSQQAMQETRASMDALSSTAFKVSAAFGAVSAAVIVSAARFEKSMTRAAAVAAGTEAAFGASFAKMETAALQMASQTEYTATEVSQGMEKVGMAGNDAANTIAMMPSVLQLATAASVDLAGAADTVTNIMAGFGLTTDKLSQSMKSASGSIPDATDVLRRMKKELKDTNNVLVATFTGSNTSLVDLGEAFKAAGPVAKQLGRGIDELAAGLGLLGNAGIQGSEAGVGLKRALTVLIGATPKAKLAMKQLGLETTDVAKKGLPFIVRQLEFAREEFRKAGKETEFTAKLFEVFGERAGPKMGALVEQGVESLVKLQARIAVMKDQNIAEFLQTQQLKTFSGAVDLATSAIDAFAKGIGKELKSILRPVLVLIQELFSKLSTLPQAVKKFIAVAMITTTVVAGLVAVFAALVSMILGAGLAVLGLPLAFEFLAGAAASAAAGIASATTALLSFLAAAAPVAVAFLLLGTLALFVVQTVKEGGGAFVKFGRQMVAPFKDAGKVVRGTLELASEGLSEFSTLLGSVSKAGVVFYDFFAALTRIVPDFFATLVGLVPTFVSALVGGFADMFGVIFGLVGRLFSWLATQASTAMSSVLDFFVGVGDTMMSVAEQIFPDITSTAVDAFGGILDGIGQIGEGFSLIFGGIGSSWADVWNGIKKVTTGVTRVIVTIIDFMVGGIITSLSLMPRALLKVMELVATAFQKLTQTELGQKALGMIGVDVKQAEAFASSIVSGTKNARENIRQLAKDMKESASLGRILDDIERTSGGIVEFMFELFDPTDFIETLKRGLANVLPDMTEEAKKAAGLDDQSIQKLIADKMKDMLAKLGSVRAIKPPAIEGEGSEKSKKATEDRVAAIRDLIQIINEEKKARADLTGFAELNDIARRFAQRTEAIRAAQLAGDFVTAGEAANELRKTQNHLTAEFIKGIKNSKRRADALEQVRKNAEALGVEFAKVRDAVPKLSFDEVTAEFGPTLEEALSRAIFERLPSTGISAELTKGATDIIGSELAAGLLGSGGSIGAAIGGAIGAAFGSPQIGAAIGSALEGTILAAFDKLKSAVASVVDVLSSLTGDTRFEGASKAAADAAISATAAALVSSLILGIMAVLLPPLALIVGTLAGLVAFTAQLAMQSQAVKDFQEAMSLAVDLLMTSFQPLRQVLMPLVGLFIGFLAILQPFVDAFVNGLVQNREAIFDFTKVAVVGFGHAVLAAATFGNTLIFAVQVLSTKLLQLADLIVGVGNILSGFGSAVLGAMDVVARALMVVDPIAGAELLTSVASMRAALQTVANELPRDARSALQSLIEGLDEFSVDPSGIQSAIDAISSLTMQEAENAANALLAAEQTQSELNEVLTNIPQGFKVARERFEAIVPGLGDTVTPTNVDDDDARGDRFDIGQLLVIADDPEALMEALRNLTRQQTQEQTGSRNGTPFQRGGSL